MAKIIKLNANFTISTKSPKYFGWMVELFFDDRLKQKINIYPTFVL